MHSKNFKFVALALAITFLSACGAKTSLNINGIEEPAAVESVNEIQTVEGTPAEKVETYSEKAIEAQAKLQLLLDSEGKKSSLLDTLMPTAFAEELTLEDQIAALLVEIETYTELAAEAATEEKDPVKLAGLLDRIQEVQTSTAEIVANPPLGLQRTLFDRTKLKVAARVAEVDEAAAEVENALESGAEEVEVDIETDVEDFLAGGERSILLAGKNDPQRLSALKIQNAVKELEKVRARVGSGEISEEGAAEILAGLEAQIATAKSLAANGEFEAAIDAASEGKREINKVKSVVARAKDAKARVEELQKLAEGGDAAAAEKLEKLQPFLEEDKKLQEMLTERRETQKEFLNEAQTEREDLNKIRRGLNSDLLDLKKSEAAGEISSSEFEEQKDALFQKAQELREQRSETEQKLREEHLELLGELNGLSAEEAKVQREELREEIQTRERVIRADQKRLYDAIQTGNEESIKAVKAGIQAKQEKAREEQRAKVERFIEQKLESLSDTEKEELENKKEELKEIRGENKVELKDIKKGVQEIQKQILTPEGLRRDEKMGDIEVEPGGFEGAARGVKRDVQFAPPILAEPSPPQDSGNRR